MKPVTSGVNPSPVLYSFRRCPYAMRARLALAISGQPCRLREVLLRNKPSALLQASPKGTVPVLVLPDGRVIDESLDIMMWALEAHDPGHWLNPSEGHLTDLLDLISQNDGHFKHHLDRYKYPNRFDLDSGQPSRDTAAIWLLELNQRLGRNPWLAGSHATLADMAILPFIRQFAHTDREWFYAQAWPHLQGWLDRWLVSDLFAAIMNKYPVWEAGAEDIVFYCPDL